MSARPSYLIDAPVASLTPQSIFTRVLAPHRGVGLTCEQIEGLLDVSREFHERQLVVCLEFAQVTEALELKRGRVDSQAVALRQALLHRHAQLFLEHERIFFEAAQRGHDLMTDEQIERADTIYHAEKDDMLDTLSDSLNHAIGPNFVIAVANAETAGAVAATA
jgi:hypothetical protein